MKQSINEQCQMSDHCTGSTTPYSKSHAPNTAPTSFHGHRDTGLSPESLRCRGNRFGRRLFTGKKDLVTLSNDAVHHVSQLQTCTFIERFVLP